MIVIAYFILGTQPLALTMVADDMKRIIVIKAVVLCVDDSSMLSQLVESNISPVLQVIHALSILTSLIL